MQETMRASDGDGYQCGCLVATVWGFQHDAVGTLDFGVLSALHDRKIVDEV